MDGWHYSAKQVPIGTDNVADEIAEGDNVECYWPLMTC